MAELWGIPLGILTPSALLGLTVLMLFTGKLWTNPAYQEKAKEAEKWRLAYEAENKARAIADTQAAQLLEQAKTTHALVVSMFGILENKESSGGTHVVPLAK